MTIPRELTLEVADVFNKNRDAFLIEHQKRLSKEQIQAFLDICNCRTFVMGGHSSYCPHCGVTDISYNSCRNRNCPKCGFQKKIAWLYRRKKDILPIVYYHVVFTLPEELNSFFVIHRNKEILYTLFFHCMAYTIDKLSKTEKYYSGKTGVIGVLHTWGQTLTLHPHIHCILTGGGFDERNQIWIDRKKFLFPVKVMSRLFKGKFLHELRKLSAGGKLVLPNILDDQNTFANFLSLLYRKEWVVYCKEPFSNPDNLVEYLGRYTHRIAISNQRILEITEKSVSFQFKDYRDGKSKAMTLSHEEFIRRFLLHVLPSGFTRIRYFGILANPCRKKYLAICRNLLKDRVSTISPLPGSWKQYYRIITGYDYGVCKYCKIGFPIIKNTIQARSPP